MNPFENLKKDYSDKKVLIFGLGSLERGADVAKTFSQIGCKVHITDLKIGSQLTNSIKLLKNYPISYTLGKHERKDIDNSDVILRNPAVDWHHPLLSRARKKNIPIVMDTSLFTRYFPGTLIGVTGTRGKTTTTNLVYNLLKEHKTKKVILGGNASKVANISFLRNAGSDTIVVSELSSWELQGFRIERKSPHIAVITNIYLDHMDHYKTFEEYISDKEAIFTHQSKLDHLLLNKDNHLTSKMGRKAISKVHWFTSEDVPSNWKLKIPGDHNLENIAAALKVGELFDINKDKMKDFFTSFRGIPHRLEFVKTINGVEYINDTTSTTPISTIKALEAMTKPVILLVGGNSKKLPISDLVEIIPAKTKAVIFLKGTGTRELEKKFSANKKVKIISKYLSFKESIIKASEFAEPGDVILLSPAFTSFSEFNNIIERGNSFINIVNSLSFN